MKPKAIPDRWLEYKACGSIIEGTRLICFKVPLRKTVQEKEPSITKLWDIPSVLSEIPRLGAVIDLTNTNRYYNPSDFLAANVLHKKILMPGRVIPPEDKVKEFMEAVDEFLGRDCDSLVGVHCTHGLNRTGYMVCRYLRDRLGVPAAEAIQNFEKARGYKIERDVYIKGILDTTSVTGKAPNISRNYLQTEVDRDLSDLKVDQRPSHRTNWRSNSNDSYKRNMRGGYRQESNRGRFGYYNFQRGFSSVNNVDRTYEQGSIRGAFNNNIFQRQSNPDNFDRSYDNRSRNNPSEREFNSDNIEDGCYEQGSSRGPSNSHHFERRFDSDRNVNRSYVSESGGRPYEQGPSTSYFTNRFQSQNDSNHNDNTYSKFNRPKRYQRNPISCNNFRGSDRRSYSAENSRGNTNYSWRSSHYERPRNNCGSDTDFIQE